jgi:pimeloyl-ACP methyl ester carboxylesterase
VFVHGLAGSATNWTDLMGALADRLDCTAVDLPGFGWSPPPADGDYSPSAHARAVVDVVEVLGGGPVHLFGNSLGGAIVTRVAALRPELVRSLVLISPALPVRRARRTNVHLPVLATPVLGEVLMRRLARVAIEQRVRASYALIYADAGVLPPQRLAEAVAEARRRAELDHDADAVLRSLRGVLSAYLHRGPEALWSLAGRVSVPTLLLYGLRDRLVDPRTAARAARTFPNARLVSLPHSGHVAQMEHPELVAHVVRRHLDDIARSERAARRGAAVDDPPVTRAGAGRWRDGAARRPVSSRPNAATITAMTVAGATSHNQR